MIIERKIKKEELKKPFIKAVVDVERGKVSISCELHIDCADELLKDGSLGKSLWGINIYPDKSIDFVSLINIRPAENNRSMKIESGELRDKIQKIVNNFL